MSSIIVQQTKLDLELVPKEKRLDIGKCNGRLNPGKIQREPTFQVVLDALALTTCYSAFLVTADVPEVYMHQFWDSVYKHDTFYKFKIDKRNIFRLTLEILVTLGKSIHSMMLLIRCINPGELLMLSSTEVYLERQLVLTSFVSLEHKSFRDKTLFWRNKIGMHTSKDDYLINTLRFVSAKEATQIYEAILPESLTSPEMKETKAYKTCLVSTKEPTGKSKRVKRPAKKSTQAPARGVVIRETPEMLVSKKKEKVDVVRGKGIELLSQVALTKDAQYEEVQRKSMIDFHKTHPSGSGTVTKPTPSAAIIKPSVTNEGTGVKPGVPDVTKEESSETEVESWGNDEDDSNNDQDSRSEGSDQDKESDDDKTQSDNEDESDSEHETDENESCSESDQEEDEEKIEDDEEKEEDERVKTLSNDSDNEDETKIANKAEGDEDEEIDYTISLLYDDVDIMLNEPVDTDKGFVQEEGTDAAMTNVQQGNENPEIPQVIEDAHVTLSTVPQKTEVPVSSSSHSFDLEAKFLNFLDIPTIEAEIVSPIDVHVHHEVPSKQTPTLLTVPVSVITDSSPVFSTVIPHSLQSFTPPPLLSTPTPPPTTEATNPPSTLPNFASVFQFNNRVTTLEKEVVELKKDPLHTQVTALVDEHLDAKLGATKDEFMNFLSASLSNKDTNCKDHETSSELTTSDSARGSV
ncbi:hypothetical protein Tco_0461477 [Tanacetum coccineum]